MIRSLGKLLQVLGLVVLPASMVMQLTSEMRAPTGMSSVSVMLLMLGAGVAVFALGRVIEGYGGGRDG